VIAAARGEQKAAVCRELGAHHVINTQSVDFVDAVKERTDGRGADVIFDPVGGDTFVRSTKCVAFEGRIVTVGFASGEIPSLSLSHALVKNYSLVGLHQGLYNRRAPQVVADTHTSLMALYEAGRINPLIHAALPFESLPEGLETIQQRNVRGKIVLSMENAPRN
jgi:NADPH:quinone reductase